MHWLILDSQQVHRIRSPLRQQQPSIKNLQRKALLLKIFFLIYFSLKASLKKHHKACYLTIFAWWNQKDFFLLQNDGYSRFFLNSRLLSKFMQFAWFKREPLIKIKLFGWSLEENWCWIILVKGNLVYFLLECFEFSFLSISHCFLILTLLI